MKSLKGKGTYPMILKPDERNANKLKRKNSTRTHVSIALTTAIIAVLTQLSLPSPTGVPVTLQTFAVALAGYILLPKQSFYSILLYLLIGAVGLPVFTNFRGGPGHLLGMTGGFLWGHLIYAPLCGLGIKWAGKRKSASMAIACGSTGLLICHALGTLQYAFLTAHSVKTAFLIVSLPYLPKDILCVITAYLAAKAVRRQITLRDSSPSTL